MTQDWWERRAGCWFVFPSQVYQSLFPLGESAKYAHLVFKSIDRDNTGCLKFESEFQLSSLHHKCLYWTIKKWGPTMMKILIMQVYGVTSKYPQEGLHLETSWTFSPFSAKDLREIRWQMFLSFSKKDLLCKVFGQIGIGIGTEGWKFGQGKFLVLLSPRQSRQAFLFEQSLTPLTPHPVIQPNPIQSICITYIHLRWHFFFF